MSETNAVGLVDGIYADHEAETAYCVADGQRYDFTKPADDKTEFDQIKEHYKSLFLAPLEAIAPQLKHLDPESRRLALEIAYKDSIRKEPSDDEVGKWVRTLEGSLYTFSRSLLRTYPSRDMDWAKLVVSKALLGEAKKFKEREKEKEKNKGKETQGEDK